MLDFMVFHVGTSLQRIYNNDMLSEDFDFCTKKMYLNYPNLRIFVIILNMFLEMVYQRYTKLTVLIFLFENQRMICLLFKKVMFLHGKSE